MLKLFVLAVAEPETAHGDGATKEKNGAKSTNKKLTKKFTCK